MSLATKSCPQGAPRKASSTTTRKRYDLSQPREVARYVLHVRANLHRPLRQEEVTELAEVMRTVTSPEVPFLLWSLLNASPDNLFLVHPHVQDILLKLSEKPSPELQAYMASHRNTVDARKFPVYAALVAEGAIRYDLKRNRFAWAPIPPPSPAL